MPTSADGLRTANWQSRLSVAQDWIAQCSTKHQRCQRRTLPRLPRRVIDVGHREAVLVETSGEEGSYIALSHCWGDSKPLTTTKATLKLRLGRLFTSELPVAFQEAIEIVRMLDIRYLWIDSLCILQDDLQDWDLEAARMASVYENAHLTIALHQPGPGETTLAKKFTFFERGLFNHSNASNGPGSWEIVQFKLHESVPWHHNLDADKLNSRGWVYQVRIKIRNKMMVC